MTDRPSPLPPELTQLLRAPAPLPPRERARRIDAIMAALPAVAAAPAPRWPAPPTVSRWRRRGVLGSAGALAVALLITLAAAATSLTGGFGRGGAMLARAEVIRDTVIARPAADSLRATLYAAMFDTMQIVRFALRAPAATRVALVHTAARGAVRSLGDSAAQHVAVARSVASGLWELRALLPRDAVLRSYAFLVDDSVRVAVRATPQATGRSAAPREQPAPLP